MTPDTTQEKDSDSSTAGPLVNEVESLEEQKAELEEREQKLERGEVEPPWPHTSTYTFYIAGGALVMAGGLIGYTASVEKSPPFVMAAIIGVFASAALINYGRWIDRHFETGRPPTYGETPDEHGGDA